MHNSRQNRLVKVMVALDIAYIEYICRKMIVVAV